MCRTFFPERSRLLASSRIFPRVQTAMVVCHFTLSTCCIHSVNLAVAAVGSDANICARRLENKSEVMMGHSVRSTSTPAIRIGPRNLLRAARSTIVFFRLRLHRRPGTNYNGAIQHGLDREAASCQPSRLSRLVTPTLGTILLMIYSGV